MACFDNENEEVKTAVEKVYAQLHQYAPQEFAMLIADPEKKKRFNESTTAITVEQFKLSKEFRYQPDDISSLLPQYLSPSRLEMIQKGFDFETFCMKIDKKSDGKYWVDLTRDGEVIEPAREVKGTIDINWAKGKQGASIIVEAVQLLKSVGGNPVSPSPKATEKAIDETVSAIKSSSRLQKALDSFVKAWNEAGGSAYKKATALFFLIKDSYAAGILWTIIKALCSDLSWYDWLLTAAKVIAMIIASLATEGAALIAEIALIVLSAVDFARKIANLNQLKAIEETMQ